MDIEDEEAPPNKSPSPPLQQPSDDDSPQHLSTNALECDTDTGLTNFSNSGALEAVIGGESNGATTSTVVDDVAVAEGVEMQVMEDEIVVEESGNEETGVDLEAAKVEEEEANLKIGEEVEVEVEVRDEKSISSNLMVEEEEDVGEQEQEEEVEQEQEEEVEQEQEEEDHNLMGEEEDVGEQQQEEEQVQEEQDHNLMGEEEDVGEQQQQEEVEQEQEQEEEEHEQQEEEEQEKQQEEEEQGHNLMGEEEEDVGEQQQEEVEQEQEQDEEEHEQEQEQQLEQEEEDEEQERGDDEEEGEEQERGDEEEEGEDEEGEEEEEEEEEEAGADGDIGLAENREAGEEMEVEVAEEQSGSVSGGKRKRGSGKNSKSSGRVPSKKKMEEDVCFICFDGGDLVLCDRRGCPKAYHPSCINRDEAFFRAKGKWNCGWHLCSNCQKTAFYMCYTCTFSLCKGCVKDASAAILCVRGNKGFCETCMRTVMLIEQNEQGNNTGQVDFDDKNSWEYLFKDYYIDLKGKLSLTFDELSQAKNPWKGSDVLPSKEESPDELFDASNDKGSDSDSPYENVDLSRSKKRKAKKRAKSRSKEGNSRSAVTLGADGPSADESSEWASKELLEFVMHMRNGEKSILSQFDVQALLLEYIKRNKLRDPRRKSQIICDARLQSLFGKPRVGHFEMLKLLESHFLLKEDSQAEDLQGSVVDTEVSHLDGDVNADTYLKAGKDKKRKNRKKGDERGLQSNIDDYAAIDNHNITLIYLKRNLVEDLLEDTEKFHDIVVGSFVRIRISGSGQKQDLYRLVQVVGTCKATEPYKVGKRVTEILLEILNLNKTEIVSIDIISNQEFTEDECKRLRQSIKCGLINRLTVGDIQDKALALQAVRVKDWLETEIVRLSHLRDRASEKGRRKELRECVEKLQLLKTPEERQRRLEEIPEIHVDPNMDPSYESDEGDAMEDKRQENYMRPRGSTGFGRRGREIVSPRSGSISSDSWSGTRNHSNKGFSVKVDDVSNGSELLNDAQLHQGRDKESQLSNSRERQKLLSSSFESNAKNTQPLVTSDSFSTAVTAASAAPSSAGIALSAVQINESEKMWHYQDPSAKVQGPFSIVQLRKWNNTGYFPADLRIWKATERQDESILLTDALAGKFSKEPSVVDKTPPKAQTVHDLQYSSPYSRKSPLAVQGIEGQVGGRPTLDQKSGSWNSHSTLGSPGQSTGGNWRSKDNMNPFTSKTSPLAVEVPKNPGNGWGSDAAGVRNESANLPSPTPQTNSGGTKGQAFENKWSPTPVQVAGSLLGNSFPGGSGGLQASVAVRTENVVHNAENVSASQPGMASASTDARQLHPQATAVAQVLATGVDIKTAAANMQNQFTNSHNSHAEAQGWAAAGVSNNAAAGVSNNAAAMPAQQASHGVWGDASSVQNPNLFTTGNPTGSLPMHGFPGMIAPEPWRPPASSNQSNITAPAQPNINWGMGMLANQNISWNGAVPANMNVNWMMPAQVPAPGNANPGWVTPAQGLPPVNAAGWVAPGQGHPQVNNVNAGWAVPGQVLAPGSWAAPAANPGMWTGDQSHNGDRFPNQGDRGTHGGDSGYGGKPWNRQSSFGSGGRGGSSRPPVGGQRGICRFHESGRCRKGASCDYQHN